MSYSILHVEDDHTLATLVKTAFESFGFTGAIQRVATVREALTAIEERKQSHRPVHLVLTDLHLPDGTGFDVISAIRSLPSWRTTPVVVLSSDVSDASVNDAYALGANCFLPKVARSKGIVGTIKSLYSCWLDTAALPRLGGAPDQMQIVYETAVRLRSLRARVYLKLASSFADQLEISGFWLGCAMNEGNFSNMLAFLRRESCKSAVPHSLATALMSMQAKSDAALSSCSLFLNEHSNITLDEAMGRLVDYYEKIDFKLTFTFLEMALAEHPVASKVFCAAVAQHWQAVSEFIGDHTEDIALLERARILAKNIPATGRTTASRNSPPIQK